MFEIGVVESFEAAHSLKGDFGPATRLHGHTYKVHVTLGSSLIDETGTFFDVGRLRAELRAVLDGMHFRNLDELTGFSGQNTTAEVVARYIFSQLKSAVRDEVQSMKVTVWESDRVFASYSGPVKA